MKYFSTFTGIGGFELGIGDQHECVGYSEVDKYAVQIYQSHFPTHKNYGDITKIKEDQLPDFEMLVGGFPCQAFSIAGKRGGFEDTRGTLFFDIARILKVKRPRLLLLENVKGLLSHDNGRTFKTIISTLTELGYDCQWQVLNSKNHGVPQNRERVLIVGHLRGTPRPEVFPIKGTDGEATESSRIRQIPDKRELSRTLLARDYKDPKVVRVADYRNDEGLRIRKNFISPNLTTRRHSSTDISTMPPIIIRGQPVTSVEKYNRVYDGMSIRRLTPVECERLQGFPDNWTKEGVDAKTSEIVGISDTQRYKCLGNAVTTNVIRDVTYWLLKALPHSPTAVEGKIDAGEGL